MNMTLTPSLKSWRSALLAVLPLLVAPSLIAQDTASDPKKNDESVKLQAFEVTGSRIRRLDTETPNPVVVISRSDFDATGFSNVDDALRALPFNNSTAIVPEGSGNGFANGTSTINLRGLGNNNTLVLINGRRAVPSGAGAFNGFQSVIDLRQIPTAAIESIEVLKDGASAIYGSDAVSGVLNIKLRRDYTGIGMNVSFGNTIDTDSIEKTAFLIAGAHSGKTSIVATANYSHRNAIMDRDLEFSRTADLRQNRTGTGQVELTSGILTGIDLRSGVGPFPAIFFIPGTNTTRSYLGPTADPNPTAAVATSRATGAGFYDFQQNTAQRPEFTQRGFSIFLHHDFSDTFYGFADLNYTRVKALNASAPSPFTSTDRGAGTNNRLLVPADNPFNPYGNRYFPGAGQAIELAGFRLVNAGARASDSTSDYPRMIFGVGGDLPFKDWKWEAAHMFAQGTFENLSRVAYDNRIQDALRGLDIAGQRLYANPFGPEDTRVTDYYSGINPNITKFTGNIAEVTANGSLLDLPGGPLGVAVGAEYRTETILDVRTQDNESGNIVGGAEGFGYSGDRKVNSFYAELSIPITKQIEAQIAGRHEDYSDFGKTFKPKFALSYRPAKWLLFRGSYSESFRAPDLAFLYSAYQVSFTGGQVADPRRPDQPPAQLKTVGRGNPDLQPEETETTAFGLVFEVPSGPLKGLSLDVGYFKFDQTNLITRDSANFTLANELLLPSGRVVRKALTAAEIAAGFPVGIIDFVSTDWYNANGQVYEGYDLGVGYTIRTARLGQFRLGAQATYLANQDLFSVNSFGVRSAIDIDGNDPVPLWRGNATIAWQKEDWSASLFVSYIGEFQRQEFGGITSPRSEAQVLFNPQVSYRGLWKTNITIGARNVLNEEPPEYFRVSTGYYPGVHSGEPLFWYVRLAREF